MTLDEVLKKHPLPFALKNYQVTDINALMEYDRALLDSCVGSGKTVESTYLALMRESPAVVILVPPILIVQWVIWLKSLNVGKVLGYDGSPAVRRDFDINVRWLVTSYGLFKNDYDRLTKHYEDIPVLTLVDEAQVLKNAGTKIHRAVRDFSLGKELLMMTGTPLSSPADAYGSIKLRTPLIYRSQSQFEMIHVAERNFFGEIIKWKNLDRLAANFRLNCVYRSKEDVKAESPQGKIIPIYYKLSPAHMKLYHKLMEEQIYALDDGSKIDATTANALYHAAQQIIVNYDHFSGNPDARSNAYDLLDEVCEEIDVGNHKSSKLLVWAIYKRSNQTLHKYLQKYGCAVAYSGSDSKAAVKRFMEDDDCRILEANPGSAGAGLNPQAFCNHALFMETPTRTIQFTQASGRIDRLGQPLVPINRIGVAMGTIQESLYRRLLSNDDLVNVVAGNKRGIRAAIYGIE